MDAEQLTFTGVAEQSSMLRSGTVRARDLVSVYLDRIERLNPALNAFASVRRQAALREADDAQHAIDAGDSRPLLGIPFAVKDEHHLAGEVTSYGTGAATRRAEHDDDIVRILRDAGAVPIGKTTMPELGMHPFTESGSWGITRNPWDLGRTSGGSSGGSAVAVAAGLATFATASDGGGSLRIPASCCNLFGLKVQRGRLPTSPLPAGIGDLSTTGVLTRTVADAALLYDLLATGSAGMPSAWGEGLSASVGAGPAPLRIAMAFKLGARARVDPEVRTIVEGLAEDDGAGYDIEDRSVKPPRRIEVKGHAGPGLRFYVSANEWNVAHDAPDLYEIHYWGEIDLARPEVDEYRVLVSKGYPMVYRGIRRCIGSGSLRARPDTWVFTSGPDGMTEPPE